MWCNVVLQAICELGNYYERLGSYYGIIRNGVSSHDEEFDGRECQCIAAKQGSSRALKALKKLKRCATVSKEDFEAAEKAQLEAKEILYGPLFTCLSQWG